MMAARMERKKARFHHTIVPKRNSMEDGFAVSWAHHGIASHVVGLISLTVN